MPLCLKVCHAFACCCCPVVRHTVTIRASADSTFAATSLIHTCASGNVLANRGPAGLHAFASCLLGVQSLQRPPVTVRGLMTHSWQHCGESVCHACCRWKEALDAGKAPPIVLESCSEAALKVVSMDQLKQHALQSAQ